MIGDKEHPKMNTDTLMKKQTVSLILYNIEESDVNKVKTLFNNNPHVANLISQREGLVNKVSPNDFTQPQKLLITLYLHLYAALHSRNIVKDKRLKNIRQRLKVSDDFASTCFQCIKKLSSNAILKDRAPIENIIKPTNELTLWAANVVFQACREGKFIEKQLIRGLDPREYEHPLDKKALDALEGTPGLETLVKKLNQYGIERVMRVRYTGSNIKVYKYNFPHLYKAIETVCNVLNTHPMPDLYIDLGFINALTIGVEKPIIVLTSGCVGLLSYDELLFVLGHEIGHIKSQHILYHQMALALPIMGEIFASATLGVGGLAVAGLEIPLLNWYRKSEFTADRAGLLACQNVEAATTAMMKIAGAPPRYYKSLKPSDFEKQAKEFEGFDIDKLDKIAKYVSVMFLDHPWTVMRGHELYRWIESGKYDQILKRHTIQNLQASGKQAGKLSTSRSKQSKFCTNCGAKLTGSAKFCMKCGSKL